MHLIQVIDAVIKQELNSQHKLITSSQLNCHQHNQYTVLFPKSYLAVKHSMVDTTHKMLIIAMDTSSDKYTSREFRQLYLTIHNGFHPPG